MVRLIILEPSTQLASKTSPPILKSSLENFYTSVSNVPNEFAEIDANCEKAFNDVPGVLKQYRDNYKELLNNPVL
jgi:hypothetical protein